LCVAMGKFTIESIITCGELDKYGISKKPSFDENNDFFIYVLFLSVVIKGNKRGRCVVKQSYFY